MSRQFPDFLKALTDYTADNFVPPQFHTWAALSIIAGALERRVWLQWDDKYAFYPNIYVMLVGRPGIGKSFSLGKSVDLLREVSRRTSTLNMMPSQVTESEFIELMGNGRSFIDHSSGRELTVFQNAGYYFASEASNSLKDIFGTFIACLTDFYDCPSFWQRATKKDGVTTLKNVCVNLLAASTFDYLGKLVNDTNIQGGFASRLIYVVHNENNVREQKWANGLSPEDRVLRKEYEAALLADLTHISKFTGPIVADAEFGAAWEAWYPKHQQRIIDLKNERLQSILARTNTNVIKVAMLLCVSESDERVLRLRHWEKAVTLVEGANENIPMTFQAAKAAQGVKAGGSSIADTVLYQVASLKSVSKDGLIESVVLKGAQRLQIAEVVNILIKRGDLVESPGRMISLP